MRCSVHVALQADIREISHRIETPSIVCVSGGGSTNIGLL